MLLRAHIVWTGGTPGVPVDLHGVFRSLWHAQTYAGMMMRLYPGVVVNVAPAPVL